MLLTLVFGQLGRTYRVLVKSPVVLPSAGNQGLQSHAAWRLLLRQRCVTPANRRPRRLDECGAGPRVEGAGRRWSGVPACGETAAGKAAKLATAGAAHQATRQVPKQATVADAGTATHRTPARLVPQLRAVRRAGTSRRWFLRLTWCPKLGGRGAGRGPAAWVIFNSWRPGSRRSPTLE